MMNTDKKFTLKNRFSYYSRYTLLFAIVALVIYAPFLFFGKALVWEHDSYTQHLKAMIFISRWYRQSLKALLTGNFKAISTYSFTLGYGSDALTTLAYYGVGDPFYLLGALVPAKMIYLFYNALIIVKNYCTGLFFSALCRRRWPEPEHDGGCIAGSLIYTFCGFALIICVGQPIFLDAMIVFPLVLLGIEKVRDGLKPWTFIIAILLATVSNFYFLPSIVIMAVLYALFRYFPIEKGALGKRLSQIVTMFAAGTVGVAMGGVILLPMILTVLSNKRIDMHPTVGLFYDAYTCRILPVDFLACDEVQFGVLCYAGTALLCVFLMFASKGYIKLKLQFILYSALLFIPAFGYLTNGLAYPINRWCWAYSALVGMIVAEMWPRLFDVTERQFRGMGIALGIYFIVCCFLAYTVKVNFLLPIIFTLFTLIKIGFAQKEQFEPEEGEDARKYTRRFKRAQRMVLYLTLAGVCVNGVTKNYPAFDNRTSAYRDQYTLVLGGSGAGASPANNMNLWINDTSQIAASIGHKTTDFKRVSNTESDYWYQNTSILNGISTPQSFWSINSAYILEYLDKLAVSDANNNAWQFTNLDNRAVLNELASISYMYCMNPLKLPTGYTDQTLDPTTANSVYPNEYPLSLGYTYSQTISTEQFEALTPAQRQEVLLTHAVLEHPGALQDTKSAEQLAAGMECKSVPFTVECMDDDVVQTDAQTFVTTDENMTVTLHFDPQKGGECYLYMKNIQFRPTTKPEIYSEDPAFDPNNLYTPYKWKNWLSPYDKYWIYKHMFTDPPLGNIKLHAEFHNGENIVTENEVNYILPDNEQFYSGRQDFLLNSYTLREGIDSIVLTFPVPGVYHFDEFSLISEPLTTYEADAKALAKESLENVNIHQDPSSFVTSTVTGEITVSDSKLLCLTIPYSEGWKAYVDGQPALIENVNIMFSGIMLTPGHHTIELHYETPGLLYGVCLTAAGILLFLFWMIMSLRSGRGRAKADQADDSDRADQTDPEDLADPADQADAAGLANPADQADAADQAGPADQADHRPNAEEIIPDAGSPGMNSADAAGGEPDASSALAGTVPESADMPENPEAESK